MHVMTHIRATLKPWDDPEFHRAYEAARRKAADAEGGDGLHAAILVERLLRETGFPHASVEVDRTAEEALTHTEHWLVTRDG